MSAPNQPLTPHTILIASADDLLVQAYAAYFAERGHNVVTNSRHSELAEYALAEPPQAIILDASDPQLRLADTVRVLRTHPATQHVPIIVIAAVVHEQERARLADLGVSAYHVRAITAVPSVARAVDVHVSLHHRAKQRVTAIR